MQKRLVLTSLVAVGCACPVFAARGEAFPTNGYMLENKTYDEAATYENMGVYEGTVTATAEYEDILYQIAAGTYLPAGATAAEQCPANSFCPGIADATYNESTAQGATSCPDGYPNSAAGAGAQNQCYTACTVDTANIAHAIAVDGNDYYDTGVDTCGATACENGYHTEDKIKVVEQTPLIDFDYNTTASVKNTGYIDANGSKSSKADTYGLTENNTWAVEYADGAVVYGHASCQETPHDPGIEYLQNNAIESPDTVRSDLTPIVGATKANYMADVVAGMADGSLGEEALIEAMLVVFGSSKDASYSTTDTGPYCYCQMTRFREAGATETLGVDSASAPWVSTNKLGSADDCASSCVFYCREYLKGAGQNHGPELSFPYRGAVLGALSAVEFGTCAANEITINWTDATADDIAANNAGMCRYDGEIRTPVRAATKPGKTFVGWKFSK